MPFDIVWSSCYSGSSSGRNRTQDSLATQLVSLSCYNKYHRLGDLSNRCLFPTVLEAGKSKVKVPADVVPDESLGPGL